MNEAKVIFQFYNLFLARDQDGNYTVSPFENIPKQSYTRKPTYIKKADR